MKILRILSIMIRLLLKTVPCELLYFICKRCGDTVDIESSRKYGIRVVKDSSCRCTCSTPTLFGGVVFYNPFIIQPDDECFSSLIWHEYAHCRRLSAMSGFKIHRQEVRVSRAELAADKFAASKTSAAAVAEALSLFNRNSINVIGRINALADNSMENSDVIRQYIWRN